jgi:hypothetical protein
MIIHEGAKVKYKNKFYDGDYPRIVVSTTFIEKNFLRLNRSEDEIIERMENAKGMWSGFCVGTLIDYVDFSRAKQFYNEEFLAKVKSGQEPTPVKITNVGEAVQDMLDYLVFGWSKAADKRGLSASRTIERMQTWLWLLGRDDLADLVANDDLYNPYGMPALIAVSEALGIKVPDEYHEFAKRKC